jgi:hypothetical protein
MGPTKSDYFRCHKCQPIQALRSSGTYCVIGMTNLPFLLFLIHVIRKISRSATRKRSAICDAIREDRITCHVLFFKHRLTPEQ